MSNSISNLSEWWFRLVQVLKSGSDPEWAMPHAEPRDYISPDQIEWMVLKVVAAEVSR